MNINAFLCTLVLAACGLAPLAQAQTCATPLPPSTPPQGATGNTCSSSNDIGTFCGLFPSPDNDVVSRFVIDGSRTATSIAVSTSTSNWNFRVFLLQGSCGTAATCADSADNGAEGVSETLSVAALAAGTYYLVVNTSGDASTASCGAFTYLSNGRLPVQLKSFTLD